MARAPQIVVPTRELAAIAFAAFRTNGNRMLKSEQEFDSESESFVDCISNKRYMATAMGNNYYGKVEQPLVVTDADRAAADEAISLVQNDTTMKLLVGRRVSEFVMNLVALIGRETANQYDVGIMAYLPSTAARIKETQVVQEQIATVAYSSQYQGQVGAKLTVDFTKIESRYMQQYNCYLVFGTDEHGNCIRYSTSKVELTESGKIQGKVREHIEDNYRNGAQVTVMNYVKRV